MMKLAHTLSFLILAGVITSCTQDELADGIHSVQGKQPLVLTANFPISTRATVDNYWDGGETVYVQVIEDYTGGTPAWENAEILSCTISTEDQSTIVFPAGKDIYWEHDDDPKLVRAWYSGTGTIDNINNSVQWEVSLWQNSSTTNYEKSDFVFAQKLATFNESIKNGVDLTFYHQVAKVVVNVRKSQNNIFSSVTSAYITAYYKGTFTPPEYDSQESNPCGIWAKNSNGYPTNMGMKKLTSPNTADFGGNTEEALVSYEILVIPIAFTSKDAELYLLHIKVDGFEDSFYYRIPSGGVNWKPGYIYTYNITITPSGLQLESFSESIGWDTTGVTGNGEAVL